MDLDKILQGESQDVEFKELIGNFDHDKKEFAKDVSAMANSTESKGLIIIGVSKKGVPIGIAKDSGIIERLQQIASTRCNPAVKFTSEWTKYQDKDLLLLHIPKSNFIHHIIDNRSVYVRRDTIIDKAGPDEIYDMKIQRSSDRSLSSNKEIPSLHDSYEKFDTLEKYDPMFFPISGIPQAYRTCTLKGSHAKHKTCPVFVPQYGYLDPEPELSDTKSAVVFDEEITFTRVNRDVFGTFLTTLEKRVRELGQRAGAWKIYPMCWSIICKDLHYGISAHNAGLALDNLTEGLFGAVFQFDRVNVYKSSCLLAVACRVSKYDQRQVDIKDFGMKLVLSSIPIRHTDWIDHLFNTMDMIEPEKRLWKQNTDAIIEKIYTLNWRPSKGKDIEAEVVGMLGRDRSPEPDYDWGLGITVKTAELSSLDFKIDVENSWDDDDYKNVFLESPTKCFSEIPIEVTNPTPLWIDIKSGKLKIQPANIRQINMRIAGHLLPIINLHALSY